MDEQKLNKKLAEWAGLRTDPYLGGIGTPNFTQSLDACFKWLVPKLDEKGIFWGISRLGEDRSHLCIAELYIPHEKDYEWYQAEEDKDKPALAFCLAIEKLIDSQ